MFVPVKFFLCSLIFASMARSLLIERALCGTPQVNMRLVLKKVANKLECLYLKSFLLGSLIFASMARSLLIERALCGTPQVNMRLELKKVANKLECCSWLPFTA